MKELEELEPGKDKYEELADELLKKKKVRLVSKYSEKRYIP